MAGSGGKQNHGGALGILRKCNPHVKILGEKNWEKPVSDLQETDDKLSSYCGMNEQIHIFQRENRIINNPNSKLHFWNEKQKFFKEDKTMT